MIKTFTMKRLKITKHSDTHLLIESTPGETLVMGCGSFVLDLKAEDLELKTYS